MLSRLALVTIIATVFFWPINTIAETFDYTFSTTESRLTKAYNDQLLKLDEKTKAEIANKCKNSQIILRDIQLESDKAIRKRISIYGDIQVQLQAIKLRMLRQGSDASEADLLYGKLQQQLDQFTIQSEKYGTTLEDLMMLNCSDKPELFMAGLVLARSQRAKVYEQASNIKKMMDNSDKEIFGQLKRRLIL